MDQGGYWRLVSVIIHTNLALEHQKQYAEYLRLGFKRHGINAKITGGVTVPGDIHVILGPWYAYQKWAGHDRVLMLDRALWREDPINVSLQWLDKDGDKVYRSGGGKAPPGIAEKPEAQGTIFLCDYGGPVEKADTVRPHPVAARTSEPLINALRRHEKAIGYKTSALVAAALQGLEVESRHPKHILNQKNWLNLITYADWHFSEIENGDAWQFLREQL